MAMLIGIGAERMMVPVAREIFEYEMVPWIGREYAAWLRTSARPHPADPHRLVLIPEPIYTAFQQRNPGERATRAQLEAMGYPRLPEDDELEAARAEQRAAALAGDTQRLEAVHRKIERLEDEAEQARRALEAWQRAEPSELERRIAWELSDAPHADVMLGVSGAAVMQAESPSDRALER
jgi:hypothetical protein